MDRSTAVCSTPVAFDVCNACTICSQSSGLAAIEQYHTKLALEEGIREQKQKLQNIQIDTALRQSPMLKDLPQVLSAVRKAGTNKHVYAKGESVFQKGELADRIIFVVQVSSRLQA